MRPAGPASGAFPSRRPGLQSRARCRRPWPGGGAGAPADGGRPTNLRPVVALDKRTAPNPVSYRLDRLPGKMRDAAVALAGRIANEAKLPAHAIKGFLKGEQA